MTKIESTGCRELKKELCQNLSGRGFAECECGVGVWSVLAFAKARRAAVLQWLRSFCSLFSTAFFMRPGPLRMTDH